MVLKCQTSEVVSGFAVVVHGSLGVKLGNLARHVAAIVVRVGVNVSVACRRVVLTYRPRHGRADVNLTVTTSVTCVRWRDFVAREGTLPGKPTNVRDIKYI